ncbi:MAG: hypothetical protein QM747_03720 [Nocardioides sp.]
MTSQANEQKIPVVDVDQAFPAQVDRSGVASTSTSADVAPQVSAALREVLGWRPRVEDPKAFVDALDSSFRLTLVEGHVEAQFVPRGYAVQADLGAVSGGQASLYRRADVMRTEMLRILDGLRSLRTDGDTDDMESYRILVRTAIQRLVDEMGAAGGPRVAMVDSYLRGLTGLSRNSSANPTADTIAGQLGALRDRFGLVDDNVNTVEEEGARTALWTLVDMVTDLRRSWNTQVSLFENANGTGFIGTDLVRISRLMEAASDQVSEVEAALDSVLINMSERRTIEVRGRGLTLDGLLSWIRTYLTEEGRQIAQDTGRDGIVSSLAPTVRVLAREVRHVSGVLEAQHRSALGITWPVVFLPVSCSARYPAGMSAARSRIAIASLCRLLCDLEASVSGVGRWAQAIPVDLVLSHVGNSAGLYRATVRGYNLHERFLVAFIPPDDTLVRDDGTLRESAVEHLVKPVDGTATYSKDMLSAMYYKDQLDAALPPDLTARISGLVEGESIFLPAEDLPLALIDGETGLPVNAPLPVHWPSMKAISIVEDEIATLDKSYGQVGASGALYGIPDPGIPLVDRTPVPPAAGGDDDETWIEHVREVIRDDEDLVKKLLACDEQLKRLAIQLARAEAATKTGTKAARATARTKVTSLAKDIQKKKDEREAYRDALGPAIERVLLTVVRDALK